MEWRGEYWNAIAGGLYALGMWLWIDSLVDSKTNVGTFNATTSQWVDDQGNLANQPADAVSNPFYYIPWIVCTLALILLNTVPHAKIAGEDAAFACQARTLVTGIYIVLFSSLAGTIWITAAHNGDDDGGQYWPYIANILCTFFIIVSCTLFRFAPGFGDSDRDSLWN